MITTVPHGHHFLSVLIILVFFGAKLFKMEIEAQLNKTIGDGEQENCLNELSHFE